MHDRRVWPGFVRGNACGVSQGMNLWKGSNPSVAKPTTSEHKGENIFFYVSFSFTTVAYFTA